MENLRKRNKTTKEKNKGDIAKPKAPTNSIDKHKEFLDASRLEDERLNLKRNNNARQEHEWVCGERSALLLYPRF